MSDRPLPPDSNQPPSPESRRERDLPPLHAWKPPRRRLPIRAFLLAVVIAFLAWVGVSWLGARIPSSGSRQQVLYYGAAASLRPGARMDDDELSDRLHRLGYHEVDSPTQPGEFASRGSRYEIFLRPFTYPEHPFAGGRVRVNVGGAEITRCEAEGTIAPEECRLEPERIAGFQGEVGAVLAPLRLEDAPELLIHTIVTVEDRRFYRHPGIDPIGTARAVFSNVKHGGLGQGGSTLTQQLARSLYLHNKKTFWRKAQEAVLATGLEIRYSKEQILEGYLNAVYWGYWGSYEIRGAREAARYYLGKELDEYRVDKPSSQQVADIALLVGLIQAPNAYSPYNSPEKAKERRDRVLHLMAERKLITDPVAEAAIARPLPVKKRPSRAVDASYFLDAVRAELARRASPDLVERPGTVIFTTLDPRDQAATEAAVKKGLAQLERDHKKLRKKSDPLQAAALVIDPASGAVRALVGGRDYLTSPFNRAIDAHRQPGSLFKPFVFLAAFRERKREDGGYWTPASILSDEPYSLKIGRKSWRPENYDHEYHGEISLRTTLEQSRNIPTARTAQEVGIEKVVQTAYDLGVVSPLKHVPSLALGASEVTLLEMTAAYGALANAGVGHQPTTLVALVANGRPVSLAPLQDPPGVDEAESYLITNLMEGVIERGTGRRAREWGVDGDVAGKSGTTDDYRDAWFVGFSPRRACGVWVGFDQRELIGLSGSAAALPIWSSVMKEIEGNDGAFHRPDGVVVRAIDPETGLLATSDCPGYLEEVFLKGTEPRRDCDRHGGFLPALRRFWPF